MAAVEERVVGMKFDNAQFERGIATSLKSLEALNKGTQLQGATKGFDSLNNAAKNVKLDHIADSVQNITDRFKAMSVVGLTALSNITNQAVYAGQNLAKSLTIDPIMKGFREYELNMNSIQTILANTAHAGTNLKDVTAALNELNEYADQTIYNFAEMTKNIGTFTAAGVDLKTSTAAIKGIANVAAVSGANSEAASRAMYQLGQALASGRVALQDWMSVENAGMGGKIFKDAIIETARLHGVKIDEMIKKEGNFRLTLQEGWFTSEILTDTLAKFTGDMDAAQLKAKGYTDSQIKEILKLGEIAKNAATEVKTMSGLIDNLKEVTGSGWAQTWQIVFGNFDEAKKLFTSVSNVTGEFFENSAKSRNKLLADWKALGGRTALIESIGNAFKFLGQVIKPITSAFREIFPKTTGKQLFEITDAIRNFTANLKMGAETSKNLKRTFAGVFAVFDIGWEIFKQVAKTLFNLFGVATGGSGSFLEVTANVGDFLVALRDAIVEGDGLAKFFEGIGKVLALPIKAVQFFGKVLASLFENVDSAAAVDSVTGMADKLAPLGQIGEFIGKTWDRASEILQNVWVKIQSIGEKAAGFIDGITSTISDAFGGLDFGDLLGGINTGLLGGVVYMLYNLIGGGGAGGIMENLSDGFETLTNSLQTVQNMLRATTLLQIAIAIGILAVSMNTLSKIDGAGLARASAAMTGMFTQLMGSMLLFEKFATFAGFAKMPFVAVSMILLGVAVNILASAVKKLADLSWEELAKGLIGTTTLLGALVAVAKFMPPSAGLISTALGFIVLGAGIKILASAVEDISSIGWEGLAKGLLGVGAILGGLILFTKFAQANKGGLIQGAGIILLASGVKILASAMKDVGELSWSEIGKGLVGMAGGLALMGAALYAIPPTALFSAAGVLVVAASLGLIGEAFEKMGSLSWGEIGKGLFTMAGGIGLIGAALILIPPTSILSAAAILVVAASLGMIASAFQEMGSMSWGEIAKSLVLLAGGLTIIGVAVTLMIAALPGAAALVVIAGALAILTPILLKFGEMSWGEIAKGLLMLAGVFAIIGAAGLILTPLVPVLIGLGAAITLLGVGMLAAGAGVLLFSMAFTALAAAGAAGTAAVLGIIKGVASTIPEVMKQIGLGIVAFARVIATAGPELTDAFKTVILSIVDAINELAPRITEVLFRVMSRMLKTMHKYVPGMVDVGLELVNGILKGIADNIGSLVDTATDVIVNFLKGLEDNTPRVLQAGADLIIGFVESLAETIRNNNPRMHAAGKELADAIIEGMTFGLFSGVGEIIDAASNVANSALDAAKNVLGIESPSKEFRKLGSFVAEGFGIGIGSSTLYATLQIESTMLAVKDKAKKTAIKMSKEFKELGKFVTKNFADALIGKEKELSVADTAFANLQQQLKDTFNSSKEDAKEARDKIKDLTKARREDAKAIKDVRVELAEAKKANDKSGVEAAEKKLKKLTEARKEDAKAIKKAREELALAVKEQVLADQALNVLNKSLQDERRELNRLAKAYDEVTAKLEDARSAYEDAVRTRDDYAKSIADQYAGVPDITDETKVEDYILDFRKELADTRTFASMIQKLRDMGLNDKIYQDLLGRGAAALPFMQNLLDSGQTSVDEINRISAEIVAVSGQLGTKASTNLYQGAVDASAALVKTLEGQQKALENQMEKLADAIAAAIEKALKKNEPKIKKAGEQTAEEIVKGIKEKLSDAAQLAQIENATMQLGSAAINGLNKRLQIRSPSRVFSNIGGYVVQGFAEGITKSIGSAMKPVSDLGDSTVNTLQSTLNRLGDVVGSGTFDTRPTITPVLDLSNVKKNASQLGSLLPDASISVGSTYSRASGILTALRTSQTAETAEQVPVAPNTITYNQYNNSPKALSSAEIYRQTRNQLSVTKGALSK